MEDRNRDQCDGILLSGEAQGRSPRVERTVMPRRAGLACSPPTFGRHMTHAVFESRSVGLTQLSGEETAEMLGYPESRQRLK